MKKVIVVFILLFFLLTSFAAGQANISRGSDVGSETREILNGTSTGVRERTNEVLAKEVDIPESLQLATRFLFGLSPERAVDMQTFVVLIALWIIAILLVHLGTEVFVPGWKAWGISIAVTLIGANTGALLIMANFLLGIGSLFGLLEEWGIVSLALTLIVLIIVLFFVGKFLSNVKRGARIGDSTQAGREIAVERAIIKRTAKTR